MPTVFTRIINGELPARFVWKDDNCVAFLSINPLRPGHTLVVPRAEIDHWLDVDAELAKHLMHVSQVVGQAQMEAFSPGRVGMMIAGLEVPHAHVHVVPIRHEKDLDFANADRNPDAAGLDAAASKIREALRKMERPEAPEE